MKHYFHCLWRHTQNSPIGTYIYLRKELKKNAVSTQRHDRERTEKNLSVAMKTACIVTTTLMVVLYTFRALNN